MIRTDGGGFSMAPTTGKRRPSILDKVSDARIVIALTRDNRFDIIKNRHSDNTGYVSNEVAIDTVCEIISAMIFQERMLLFQESVKERLIEKMSTTIEMGGGEFHDAVQRACSPNGS